MTELRSNTKMTSIRGVFLSGIGFLVAALGPTAGQAGEVDLEALKTSLRSAEEAFAQSVEDSDLEAFESFIAEDAVFSGSGESLVGREAIVKAWSIFFRPEGPRIFWSPEKVALLPDGKLGTSQGPYRVESRTGDGAPTVAKGTFFSVWRRADEAWEVILDSGTKAEPEPPIKKWDAAFAGLEWLAGRWTGEGFGGRVEEVWSTPEGGAMVGLFRLSKNSEPAFSELFTLGQEGGQLELRLKHFNRDMTGWEEKGKVISFPFSERGDGMLNFEGLRYSRDGDDGLRIEVDLDHDGEISTETLVLKRTPI